MSFMAVGQCVHDVYLEVSTKLEQILRIVCNLIYILYRSASVMTNFLTVQKIS